MAMPLAIKEQRADRIRTLSNGTVRVECGPMRMSIAAFENGKALTDLTQEGGHLAIKVLGDLARFLPVIKRKAQGLEVIEAYPEVVRRMIEATQKIGESDLTPLASVAGAASEIVADFMFSRGGTKIIVDNGGDIAIRLRGGEVAKVGMKTDIDATHPTYLISIDSTMEIGGVATSGLGGRSFTKGIASAATVLSRSASFADAAATVIGNFTNVEDSHIKRTLAERIYPDTDIVGEWVTREVGGLSLGKIEGALRGGLSKASSLCQKGLIKGAFIAVKDQVVWTDSLSPLLTRII